MLLFEYAQIILKLIKQ